jgi:CheY-like chemotaxis protein
MRGVKSPKARKKSHIALDKNASLGQACRAVKANALAEKTVLIVDDDEEVRHVLRLLCEDDGFEVVGEADNGAEALTLALHRQPDFVILDYKLPRLNGEGAAEILRVVAPDSKIVAFSALLESQPEWADGFLNKTHIGELMPLLRTFIR